MSGVNQEWFTILLEVDEVDGNEYEGVFLQKTFWMHYTP